MSKWISVEDRLPKEDEIVFIFCAGHPKNLSHSYTHLKDGSDRTSSELRRRELGRVWYEAYPIKQGSLYMTGISGLKWRTRGIPPDSSYGFFGNADEIVTHWMPIPEPPEGVRYET